MPPPKKCTIADAFQYTPFIREIKPADNIADMLAGECEQGRCQWPLHRAGGLRAADLSGSTDSIRCRRSFPDPDLQRRGEPYKQQGAVIYEGMQFVSYASGNYRVRFVVETPAMRSCSACNSRCAIGRVIGKTP